MRKAILCGLLVTTCLSGCSMFQSKNESSRQPETVVVKETVIVPETVIVTETVVVPETVEETHTTQAQTKPSEEVNSTQEEEKKGFTTAEVLKKADAEAENQYWIVFFGEGSLQMTSFNALENFTVTWKSDGELVCDKMMGVSKIKKWNSEHNNFVGREGRTDVAFRASEIVGSNCSIYDEKNDKTIPIKTD